VVGLLVLLSLLLITVHFRESDEGGLHDAQGAAATVLRPFQIAAERVAQPFRDVYGYFDALVGAKSENERLRDELTRLRQQSIQYQVTLEENRTLKALVDYRAPPGYPSDYRPVVAAVLARAPTQFEQFVVISAGRRDGVRKDDPVVTSAGLVGRVTELSPRTARVTLLTDGRSSVSAWDPETGATGLAAPGRAGSGALVLERVKKASVVNRGDPIATFGSQSGSLPSFYPRGIPIGEVSFVNQSDTDLYKRIQVEPYVDFDSLDSVIVLVPPGSSR
jgi:rod shape-determining protein MreC